MAGELQKKYSRKGKLNVKIFINAIYHLLALLIVLSSAPQRAAHRAADLRMLWVVNSFSKRALDILKK